MIELENGTLTVTDYTSFLETPVVITGAVLAYTGNSPLYEAYIRDEIIFHISAREVETQSKLYYAPVCMHDLQLYYYEEGG